MASRSVTVAQIAEMAGVSVPTVSKVLNRRNGVAEQTRLTVERILEETGYVRRGRAPRSGSGIVDLLIAVMDSQWAITVIQGANSEAQKSGLDIVVTPKIDDPHTEAKWMDRVLRRGSDGVILAVAELSDQTVSMLRRLDLPIVLIDPVGSKNSEIARISATNWAGGLTATEHLLELGHRRIGIITGPEQQTCSLDRLDGYSAALRRAGIPADRDLIRHGDSLVSGGELHGGALLDLPNPPTAIFSCSDEQAYGIYHAARDRGLRIPRDLSVVGFDDVDLCQWVSPQLTTIRQPLQEMGAQGFRQIVKAHEEGEPVTQHFELPTSLVVRASTARPGKKHASTL